MAVIYGTIVPATQVRYNFRFVFLLLVYLTGSLVYRYISARLLGSSPWGERRRVALPVLRSSTIWEHKNWRPVWKRCCHSLATTARRFHSTAVRKSTLREFPSRPTRGNHQREDQTSNEYQRLPVTSPPGRLATKERSRHQAKSSRHQPPIKR